MKNIFQLGDQKTFQHVVDDTDFAQFHGEIVHRVYSTFSLARDMEWTTRQFVIEMRDADEEGIGTFVHVDHRSPAFEGECVRFTGVIESLNGNEIICSVTAKVDEREVAVGKTGQKILRKERLHKLLRKP